MTQEEKELLLKDLCARLAYGVRMKAVNEDFELSTSTSPKRLSYVLNSADFKPYLRPMSSMTEEEERDWWTYKQVGETWEAQDSLSVDWLNKSHFDYRGLIEKGVAIEAPEGMYKTK